jgi:hypothetical protein
MENGPQTKIMAKRLEGQFFKKFMTFYNHTVDWHVSILLGSFGKSPSRFSIAFIFGTCDQRSRNRVSPNLTGSCRISRPD